MEWLWCHLYDPLTENSKRNIWFQLWLKIVETPPWQEPQHWQSSLETLTTIKCSLELRISWFTITWSVNCKLFMFYLNNLKIPNNVCQSGPWTNIFNGRYAVLETLCWLIDWFIKKNMSQLFKQQLIKFMLKIILLLHHTIVSYNCIIK